MAYYEVIDIIKAGLKPRIAHLIFGTQIYSVEHLRSECRKAEALLDRESQQRSRFITSARTVNELYEQEVNVNFNPIEELKTKTDIRKRFNKVPVKYWNCHGLEHTFKECTAAQRGFFCFRCGEPGVTAPQCNHCRQGNRQANAVSGDSRSTQTTD